MHWLSWIIIILAIQEAGWMAFDGTRALTIGDYITPKSGAYAGQLGRWSKIVESVGIAPRSTLMKSIFVVYGFAWLAIIVCFIFRFEWAWWAMLIAASGSLWFVPIGTLLGAIQIVLLLLPAVRR
ncbi:MAG: hypothetical protein L0Y44_16690 [Phycisphaerales bacterium]|nr:hypothetical protein [Phycisphaerales bacterium]MCI0632282.1 hypothetical protein [Phycisphaerales bacterium]MCI0675955.1 hypothetical protein [Phycisphaerales bacterium]